MPTPGSDPTSLPAPGPSRARRSLLATLAEEDPADVGLAAEAAGALLVARVALRTVSLDGLVRAFEKVRAAAAERRADSPAGAPGLIRRLARAVDAASARLGGACLARSVALHALLARRGLASDLVIAVRARGGPLPGHAWVEVDGMALGSDGRGVRGTEDAFFVELVRLSPGGRLSGSLPAPRPSPELPDPKADAVGADGRSPWPQLPL